MSFCTAELQPFVERQAASGKAAETTHGRLCVGLTPVLMTAVDVETTLLATGVGRATLD